MTCTPCEDSDQSDYQLNQIRVLNFVLIVFQNTHSFYMWTLKTLLNVSRQYFFCGSFMCFFFCLVFVTPFCVSVYLCLVVTCWERTDLLALVCGVLLSLSLSHGYPGSGVVLDCIDS